MARQILPIVGQVFGGMVSGPWGAAIGGAIGSWLGNVIDPQVFHGPQLGEGQANTASEGGYRPIVLGTGAVGVCMLHEGPLIERTIRHRQSKGGGPIQTENRRYRTMAFGLGESADPLQGVALLRLWFDNVLVYDVRPESQILSESAEFAERFTFYPGDQEQMPDPDLEAFMDVGNVPAYRGRPYIVLPEWDVTDSRGSAPAIKAELASAGLVAPTTMAIAIGRISSPTQRDASINSPDGAEWQTALSPLDIGQFPDSHIAALGQRFVVWNSVTSYYTDDYGESFHGPFGSFGATGGRHQSYSRTNTLMIPGGLGNGIFLTNDGESYSNVTGLVSNNIATRGGLSISVSIYQQHCMVSTSNGASWFIGGNPTVYAYGDKFISCNDQIFSVGGRTSNVDPKPHISRTFSGTTWLGATLDTSGGTEVRFLIPGSGENWVALINNGEIWYSNNDCQTFQKSSDTMPTTPTGLAWNGALFIAGCGPSGGGQIWTSPDGVTWAQGSQPLTHVRSLCATIPTTPEARGAKIPLSYVVEWAHRRVGAESYNVSELTDDVEGVVFSDGYNAADAVRSLMGLYFFDSGEFDAGAGYQLNYIKRGKPAVMTLAMDDVVEGPEEWRREDSYERPKQLHVAYANPVADYNAPQVTIKRTSPDVLVTGERSASVPVTFSDVDEITRRADIMMTVIYSEIAGSYEVVLPDSLIELAPTDCIGFNLRGRTRRLRMTELRFGEGMLKTEWMADRQSAITSNVTGLPVTPTKPPPPSIVGPTVSAVLDIPALTDGMDNLHLLAAASGQTPAWWGAWHERRLEAETDFSPAVEFRGMTTVMGVLQGTVTAASPHYTDTTNVIRVLLYSNDELPTHTQQQFLSENGAFAMSWDDGGTRRWEVMQYRDAVKVGDREWELTTLLRGRLATDAAQHDPYSLFVLLDDGLRAMLAQTSWIGQDITHRAVSHGQNPEQAVPYTEEYTGQSQREWPVAHLFGLISGDDLALSCVPRHRFGTDDHPVESSNHAGYRWTATDGVNSLAADTSGTSHTFNVSGWTTPITVTVAQLNRFTGAGPAVSEEIE